METAVSAPSPSRAAGGGRSNGVAPSLSSDFHFSYLSAGVRTPRDFMAPNTCDEHSYRRRGPEPDIGPAICCHPGTSTSNPGILLNFTSPATCWYFTYKVLSPGRC